MKNLSQTAQRRSRTRGILGIASSRTYHTLRLVESTGNALPETCRKIGRRLANGVRLWLDQAATFLDLIVLKGRPVPAPILIDASSTKIRRSRTVYRR